MFGHTTYGNEMFFVQTREKACSVLWHVVYGCVPKLGPYSRDTPHVDIHNQDDWGNWVWWCAQVPLPSWPNFYPQATGVACSKFRTGEIHSTCWQCLLSSFWAVMKHIVGWFVQGVIVVLNTAYTYSCIFSFLRRYLFNLDILDIFDAELRLHW